MHALIQTFSEFTREDWREMDRLRSLSFKPTQEEIEAERKERERIKQETIANNLGKYGIAKPETITKEFVINFLSTIDAKQFIGENIEDWTDSQIELYWDIESAFDELVYTRLG